MIGRNGRMVRWLTGAGVVALVGVIGAPAGAETTPTQTQTVGLGDLDQDGSGSFDAFDPALGTLTGVEITAEVDMNFSVCVTNGSPEAESLPAGSVSGTATMSFPAGVTVDAIGEMAVPETLLGAADGGDDCAAWLDGGGAPATDDSVLAAETDTTTFAESVTDATGLEAFVGPGTVDFTFEASSASDISQPTQWTIIFLADGAGEATITYTYEPATVPTVLGVTTDRPDLPRTGGDIGGIVTAGVALTLAGTALVAVAARRRSARSD